MAEKTPPKKFYVFINVMFESAGDSIVSELVRSGYSVRAAATSGEPFTTDENNVVVVVALSVTLRAKDVNEAQSMVKDAITKTEVRYYSLAVTEMVSATWSVGNVKNSSSHVVRPRKEVN